MPSKPKWSLNGARTNETVFIGPFELPRRRASAPSPCAGRRRESSSGFLSGSSGAAPSPAGSGRAVRPPGDRRGSPGSGPWRRAGRLPRTADERVDGGPVEGHEAVEGRFFARRGRPEGRSPRRPGGLRESGPRAGHRRFLPAHHLFNGARARRGVEGNHPRFRVPADSVLGSLRSRKRKV